MGGMFTTLKVRADLGANDYRDPGDYAQPAGTQARLVDTGDAPTPTRPAPASDKASATVRKPGANDHSAHH
jgi:hypothetical protein